MERYQKYCPEVAVGGGPAGGKTTALALVSEKCQDWGFQTFIIPELATATFGGIPDFGRIAEEDFKRYFRIEVEMTRFHMQYRRYLQNIAATLLPRKMVVLSDRGTADMLGYVPPDHRQALLEEAGHTLAEVRDTYDVALHLLTAADGAEAFYSNANNKVRHEPPELARQRDKALRDVWTGCEHFKIIDNSTGFEGKMDRAVKALARGLGVPVPLEIERRYLLRSVPNFAQLGVHAQEVSIEQRYLKTDGGEELRIRKRSQWGSHVHYKTQKRRISDLVRHEESAIISALEYADLLKFQHPKSRTIEKSRFCFVYEHQYFELDVLCAPRPYLFLEIELTEEQDVPKLPPWVDIEREITGEREFSNRAIAFEETA